MKDFSKLKPRAVEAELRDVILKSLGDKVENRSNVFASHGYYTVALNFPDKTFVSFENFRKQDAGRIAKAIKALK